MAKILLVEDDKSLREIYGVRLMAEGYTIVSAGDGEEALAMAIKEKPDLIVSDVMMPKISGFDMLDILRSTTETRNVKVIMMTALSSDDQRARGEALGADRYLVKSQVGIEDVVRTVHDVLSDSPVAASSDGSNVSAFATPAAPAPVAVAPTPAPVPAPAPAPEIINTPAQDLTPLQPAPAMPVAPAPQPLAAMPPQPTAPVYTAPAPTAPVAPAAPAPAPFPPTPTPVAPQPQPVAPAPQPAAAPVAPPVFSSPLPEPTAPFSSPRPASLGDRVINPISEPSSFQVPSDMGALISQELGGTPPQTPPQAPPTPPIAPL